jgi:methylene-fatty-acyl-phospholipid synthase
MSLSEFILPLLLASFLLSFERLGYLLAWHRPQTFMNWGARMRIANDPVSALERLFYAFKLLQLIVFGSWIFVYSDSVVPLPMGSPMSQGLAIALLVTGQILNLSTFWTLGRNGVFYGARFGHNIPWRSGFPFSICPHPQYLGTVMSIWGLFLLFRYPAADWYLIPAVETVFYWLGAYFERSSGTYANAEAREAVESA